MKQMTRFLTTVFTLATAFTFAQLVEDQSYLDKDFVQFKAQLINVISDKDSVGLRELLAERVYGAKDNCPLEGCTKDDFFKDCFISSVDESWEELAAVVRFGFKRKEIIPNLRNAGNEVTAFQAPSYLDKFDYSTTLAVLGENVNIRKAPSVKSEVIAIVSYDTLSCRCGTGNRTKDSFVEAEGLRWVNVPLKDGEWGYVVERLTSNSISTQISVIKINGEWKIKSISPTQFC